ncbi:HEAT domain-containing protein [Oryctes borbonicus]|uniref:non-specific serine/threonine protein kinase n=1 Tax=Oryctes borbonicus TaxID=1629725 RepID=A0A0T6AWP7_9SCAR|nr:HEAT domain-containing protein [Oryctes borbonicus]
MREYVKYSLYDRISTRPFLTNIEKRWITFQVLYALSQCHKVKVCHGDIKLENITVTSWNWVLLVDFASFKPTFLPEDNPADYSYFFDTSRRRVCYTAPERFMKSITLEQNCIFNETQCNSSELTPAMDIFSAGCALLELWNEGHPPFEYSHLLEYRTGEYTPQKHLDKIEDPNLKRLLANMIDRDPSQRQSAESYLSQEKGRLFPQYFDTFLQPYMLGFSASPILSPDEKISRLRNDIESILNIFSPNKSSDEILGDISDDDINKQSDGLVIIVSLVTSCIRGLHDCSSKLHSLEILLKLARQANEEIILDRILPFILYLARDQNPRIKVAAINTITMCLSFVKKVPRSDANIFPEYILPGLAYLASDPSTCVRAAYAKNIATLAEIALRYLEQTQTDWYDKSLNKNSTPRINYETELQVLHEMVKQTVSLLLSDQQSLVKQTLMESGITKLCVFFGKQKANDTLLSHMITFLNDKDDKELRGTFFDCIVGVAAYLGWHCSVILTPLLLQGLTDSSEFVTTKAINAMSSLTELGLITKPTLCELIGNCACLLVHPSLWIRQAAAGFVSVAAKGLSILDVQSKLMPILSPYIQYSLIQIDRPELVLESLVSPIPRPVYDNVVRHPEINAFLDNLKKRKSARDIIESGKPIPTYDMYLGITSSLKKLTHRLEEIGMTQKIEDYLIAMDPILRKIHKHKVSAEAKSKSNDGKIEINSANTNARKCCHNFEARNSKNGFLAQASHQSDSGVPIRQILSRPPSPVSESHPHFGGSDPSTNYSMHERSYIQYRTAHCNAELRKLIARQQEHYLEAIRSREWAEQAAWQPQLPPPGWRVKGSLVAHLHEHKSPVTKLCHLPKTSFFASASIDGFVRIWDCSKMEGKNIANRSKQSYRIPSNISVAGLAVCENAQSLAAAVNDGSILVLRMDPTSSRMTLVQTRQLNVDEDGCAVDVQYLDSGPQSVLVYATLYGALVGWDMRAPGEAWRLENGLKQGVITSFCLDPHQSWLTLGTSSGHHIAWDLRFQLPIATIVHPTAERIRKVISHPTKHSWILSSVQGNNEISMWNLETGFREKVLWVSRAPPLSKTDVTNHGVCAMQAGCIDRNGFLLAGGTDQRIRFWDLENPANSCLAVYAPNDSLIGETLTYHERLIDGTSVIVETVVPSTTRSTGKADEIPRAGPEPPPAGHRDCISDIILCKASQCFMVSASRDGVIKVWK